jgi:site-specific recombinase XerD
VLSGGYSEKRKIETSPSISLRHTFASHLVMSGVDLPTVKKLMGHSDIETTMIYSHLADEHVDKAVENLSF